MQPHAAHIMLPYPTKLVEFSAASSPRQKTRDVAREDLGRQLEFERKIDNAPTEQALTAFDQLEKQFADSPVKWDALKREIAEFNKRVQAAGLSPLRVDSSR
jgi:hypothetical protein